MDAQQMLAQMTEWDKAGLVPTDKQKAIVMLTGFGDAVDDFMVKSIYDGLAQVVREQQTQKDAEADEAQRRKDFREEFQTKCKVEWDALLEQPKKTKDTKKYFKNGLYFKKTQQRDDGTPYDTYKEVSEKCVVIQVGKTITKDMIELAVMRMLAEQNEFVDKMMTPKKTKNSKKGSGSKREMKDTNAPEIVHPDYTQEKAEALYETANGCWFKQDADDKATYAEKKKYTAGQRDPLNTGKKLDKDIYLVKHKPVIRPVAFVDMGANRCECAVAFKPMRNASEFARAEGFIGDCMVQCANAKKDGSDFCDGCEGKGDKCINISDYKYKKSGKHAVEYMTPETMVCRGI